MDDQERSAAHTVPMKMFGCWERRYISFPQEDDGKPQTQERVIWVQSPSGHGDMRIAKSRSNMQGARSFAELSLDQLLELAQADSSCGICVLDETTHERGPKAKWVFGEYGFGQQVISNWPEDGWLEWPLDMSDSVQVDDDNGDTDGTCMMEYAPDGQYIEDWRLQTGSAGLCCHLTLSHEGITRNLYIAGVHLMLAIDRSDTPKEQRPLEEIVKDMYTENRKSVETYLSCEFSYAKLEGDNATSSFRIELSTLPWREGELIMMKWLFDVLHSNHSTVSGKEGTAVTDDQGLDWKVVSVCHREAS